MGKNSGESGANDHQKEAAEELLKRKEAHDRLIPFVEYTLPAYEAGNHHRYIAEKLEAPDHTGTSPAREIPTWDNPLPCVVSRPQSCTADYHSIP